MRAPILTPGSTIGIVCPSHIMDPNRYKRVVYVLEHLGYNVKFGENVSRDTDGYLASAAERAADFNAMIADESVQMVFFGGGDGAAELLPLIDYTAISRRPLLFCSYSDGTSLLNAIYAQTGLVTYYGASPGVFADLRHYDYRHFHTHFAEGRATGKFESDGPWKTLNGGSGDGILIGGYTSLFAMMFTNERFTYQRDKKYLLFLESHEHFDGVGAVNTWLSFIEQNGFIRQVTGLIFGHYALDAPADLLSRLARFGAKNNIPVVYTDDFGHGTKHAIFPIGAEATLYADKQELWFR